MTENQAFVLDFVVGLVITLGSIVLLDALGANEGLQLVAALLGLVGTSFMVGVIGEHYQRKAEAEGRDPDERFKPR
jgi:positive regulator of sigma E activity